MLFDNTKIGFVLKSNFELEKAYFLFKIISNKQLTNFGKILLNIILTFKLPFLFIVKRTVFKQFCSGSNLEESMETINKLYSKNVYSYLSYSVEGAQNNDSLEKSCQNVIDSIEFASDKKNIPFTVFKPTAISKTDIKKFNTWIKRDRDLKLTKLFLIDLIESARKLLKKM